MAVVYVVQRQMRWDNGKEQLVPRFNLRPASQYGQLQYLLEPEDDARNAAQVIEVLVKGLAEITPADSLLLVGNPCLIGWATALAAYYTDGPLQLLQWLPREKRYLQVYADIFEPLCR